MDGREWVWVHCVCEGGGRCGYRDFEGLQVWMSPTALDLCSQCKCALNAATLYEHAAAPLALPDPPLTLKSQVLISTLGRKCHLPALFIPLLLSPLPSFTTRFFA